MFGGIPDTKIISIATFSVGLAAAAQLIQNNPYFGQHHFLAMLTCAASGGMLTGLYFIGDIIMLRRARSRRIASLALKPLSPRSNDFVALATRLTRDYLDTPLICIYGGPGTEKSAFAAHMRSRFPVRVYDNIQDPRIAQEWACRQHQASPFNWCFVTL